MIEYGRQRGLGSVDYLFETGQGAKLRPQRRALPDPWPGRYQSEVLVDSPLFLWMLSEPSGLVTYDVSGNGRNGTYNGTPSLGQTSLIPTTWGVLTSMQCDGVNDSVTIADNASWDVNDLTVEMVIRTPSTLSGTKGVAARDSVGSGSQRVFYVLTSGTGLYFSVHNSSGTQLEIGPATLATDTTYHIACTRTSGAQKIYVNGVDVVSGSPSGNARSSTEFIGFGRYLTNYWNGGMQGLAFYGSALSGARVLAHAQAAGLA